MKLKTDRRAGKVKKNRPVALATERSVSPLPARPTDYRGPCRNHQSYETEQSTLVFVNVRAPWSSEKVPYFPQLGNVKVLLTLTQARCGQTRPRLLAATFRVSLSEQVLAQDMHLPEQAHAISWLTSRNGTNPVNLTGNSRSQGNEYGWPAGKGIDLR
ncbi:MAG: hypothetical protein KDJ66_14990, partial [Nitratireductor sp.]|nr:hypothetical protein [Nitratireductor sp.]